jgi:2,3-bisphosphoglycerate-dependent phosphoglycerate mutase
VKLSEEGIKEAKIAGQLLKEKNFSFDICFSSVLQRSIQTFNYIAEEMGIHHIPIVKDYRLNEKSYGAL